MVSTSKRPSSRLRQRRHFLTEMQRRIERRDLLHEAVDELLRAADGQRRDVVDRLVGIELGALAAGRAQRIDQMAADAQQSELENLEQPARAGANDHDFGDDGRLRGNLGQTQFLQGAGGILRGAIITQPERGPLLQIPRRAYSRRQSPGTGESARDQAQRQRQGGRSRCRSGDTPALGAARFPGPHRAPSSAVAWRCAAPAPSTSTGQPVRSCQIPVSAVGDQPVTTIEGSVGGPQPPGAEGLDRTRRAAMRLLPVRPDHVRLGAAREQAAARAMPTSTPPWPATSAAAAPISAFAPPSVAPRRSRVDRLTGLKFDTDRRSFRGGNPMSANRNRIAPPVRGRPRHRDQPARLQAGRRSRAAKRRSSSPMPGCASAPTTASRSSATARRWARACTPRCPCSSPKNSA